MCSLCLAELYENFKWCGMGNSASIRLQNEDNTEKLLAKLPIITIAGTSTFLHQKRMLPFNSATLTNAITSTSSHQAQNPKESTVLCYQARLGAVLLSIFKMKYTPHAASKQKMKLHVKTFLFQALVFWKVKMVESCTVTEGRRNKLRWNDLRVINYIDFPYTQQLLEEVQLQAN